MFSVNLHLELMGPFAPKVPVAHTTYIRQPNIAASLDSSPGITRQNSPPTSSASIYPNRMVANYGVANLSYNGTPLDGTGQTIAIIDAFDDPGFVSSTDPNFLTSNLHIFDQQFGLQDPPSFKKVNQSGGTVYPTANAGWAAEIALDVEWAHVMAPKANIILIEGNSATFGDLVVNAARYGATIPGVTVVSMSFGANDFAGESTYDVNFNSNTAAGGSPVTFFAASGDTGGNVIYPSSSPKVVAVGGTTLNASNLSNVGWQTETGWTSGGCGISANESKPAYQSLLTTPSSTQRTTADLSLVADPNTGVAVYTPYGNGATTQWQRYGGTSLSSPLMAGVMALVNQQRALAGLTSLDGSNAITGTLNRLYSLPATDFHDILTGTAGAYSATAGYDLVTGRGTPRNDGVNGAAFVSHMAFGNYVSGKLFVDNNTNGNQDAGDTAVSGVTVYADANGNGVKDSGESSSVTSATGTYLLADLTSGSTTIRVNSVPSGYVLSSSVSPSATPSFTGATTNFRYFPTTINAVAGEANTTLVTVSGTLKIFTTAAALGSAIPNYAVPLSVLNGLTIAGGTGTNLVADMSGGTVIPTGALSLTGTGNNVTALAGPTGGTFVLGASSLAFGVSAINFAGTSAVTVQGYGGASTTLTINAVGAGVTPLLVAGGTDTLNVNAGNYNFSTDTLVASVVPTVTVGSTGAVTFSAPTKLAGLTLNGSTTAAITPGQSVVLDLGSLAIAAGATLDMGDGAAIVRGGDLNALSALATTGINSAGSSLWTGTGITSSLAAAEANSLHGVGVVSNTLSGSSLYTSFHGITVSGSDVLIAYTLFGDADLSGTVDDTDYFLANSGLANNQSGWVHGDFDYSGIIDDTDFFLLNTGFSGV